MKKLFLLAVVAIFGFTSINAQSDGAQTDSGSWLIEANTGFGGGAHIANTGISLKHHDGTTSWSVGAEGGYFVINDLAVKLGLGYSGYDGGYNDFSYNNFSYKLGAKYYVISKIPFQVDVTGYDGGTFWGGLQGGYAIFLGENVSVEPGLRYNLPINDDYYSDEGVFEFKVGFALHF